MAMAIVAVPVAPRLMWCSLYFNEILATQSFPRKEYNFWRSLKVTLRQWYASIHQRLLLLLSSNYVLFLIARTIKKVGLKDYTYLLLAIGPIHSHSITQYWFIGMGDRMQPPNNIQEHNVKMCKTDINLNTQKIRHVQFNSDGVVSIADWRVTSLGLVNWAEWMEVGLHWWNESSIRGAQRLTKGDGNKMGLCGVSCHWGITPAWPGVYFCDGNEPQPQRLVHPSFMQDALLSSRVRATI